MGGKGGFEILIIVLVLVGIPVAVVAALALWLRWTRKSE